MKFNLKVLIPSGLAATALIAIPAVVHLTTAQAVPPQAVESLNLTPEQQSEWDALQENTRSQIEAILTPEQRTALQTSLDAGTPRRQAFRDLDLSDQQRQAMRDIMVSSREAGQNILTAEQQQQLRQARAEHHKGGRQGAGLGQLFEQLNLSPDQQSQIDAIRANTRSQIEAVLSEEQRSTFQANAEEDNYRAAFRSLNLSDEQRTEIRDIMASSRDAVNNVLTDEQQQQLRDNMRAHWGQRGQ